MTLTEKYRRLNRLKVLVEARLWEVPNYGATAIRTIDSWLLSSEPQDWVEIMVTANMYYKEFKKND